MLSFPLVSSLELGLEEVTEQMNMKLTHQWTCEFLDLREVY